MVDQSAELNDQGHSTPGMVPIRLIVSNAMRGLSLVVIAMPSVTLSLCLNNRRERLSFLQSMSEVPKGAV